MRPPRIALVTCRNLPEWERDDQPLRDALRRRGWHVDEPAWDDEQFDWSTCDLALVRTTWDYTDRVERFRRWINATERACPLLNPAPVLEWNLDKRYLRDLASREVDIVPTCWIELPADSSWKQWLDRHAEGRVGFVKPSVGATAKGTLRFDLDAPGFAAAESHVATLLRRGVAVLVQPYLATVEDIGERSAIVIDGRVTHAVTKRPRAGDYRVQDDWGGTDAPHQPSAVELRLVERALAAAGAAVEARSGAAPPPLSYARVDWLTDGAGQPHLVELELIEPSLFFRHAPQAAEELADSLLRRISASSTRTL